MSFDPDTLIKHAVDRAHRAFDTTTLTVPGALEVESAALLASAEALERAWLKLLEAHRGHLDRARAAGQVPASFNTPMGEISPTRGAALLSALSSRGARR